LTSTTLTPGRALRRPRRIDVRAVLGICLLLVAVGGSIAFWSASSDSRAVLVVTRDLPAMAVLGVSDLAVAHVRVDDAIYQAAIPAHELNSLIGKPLAEPAHAQQLLVRDQVSGRPPLETGQMVFTIAVAPETAAGGRVRPGDHIQVFVTLNKGKPDVQTNVVLSRVMVYDVGYEQRLTALNTDGAGSSTAQGAARWLSLIVSEEQAQHLAQAKWSGDVDVALLPPEP
jgi:Flp pilus assembly protein CpaB